MTDKQKSRAAALGAPLDAWAVVSRFAPYLRIAHQLPGRVRLKLDSAVLDDPMLRELGAGSLKQALSAVRGVQDFSFNLLARSCTVSYDAATIADAAWPDLLAGKASPEAQNLIDILHHAYQESGHAQL